MHQFTFKIVILLATLFISACAIGPDYEKPKIVLNGNFKEVPPGWKVAQPGKCVARQWWLVFNDPLLNSLMTKVTVNNQSLLAAIAAYKQALALVDEARANYWPDITLNPSDVRSQNSQSSNTFFRSQGPSTTYTLTLNGTWSPDIFGLVQRTVEASQAGADAAADEVALTQLSLQSLLAQDYLQLRVTDLIQKLLDDTVVAYKKNLELTHHLYAAGVDSRLDVSQAESQLETAMTAAIDNHITRATYEHAIAVLIGQTPENFSIAVNNDTKLILPRIPVQVPSTVLELRPDVAQSERLVAQANANIGVAIAGYFPLLTLSGDKGYSSLTFTTLTNTPSHVWSAGAAVVQTIFNGGLVNAQVRAARATYDQTVANYKQTVLTALQQVEDNLVTLRYLESEVQTQQAAVASAELALKLTMANYKAGTEAYTDVIVAQNAAYTAKQTALTITGRRLVATVGLIQALGGVL